MKWIKTNLLTVILIGIVAFLVIKQNGISQMQPLQSQYSQGLANIDVMTAPSGSAPLAKSMGIMQQASDNRVVIRESNLSLLVEDVEKTGDKIISYAKQSGGYMVDTSYTRPTESPFANITVRVPTEKLDEALVYFKSLSLKVTSENLVGTDVTDQYTDIQSRLDTLNQARAKFEEIMAKATSVDDIVNVQQQLMNIQEQIDSYKGQQKAIDENAKLTKIIVYLSTDELALPYTPDTTFRPAVIFKQAVRSLLNTLRLAGEGVIWLAVYSPAIIVVIVLYFGYKKLKKKPLKQ